MTGRKRHAKDFGYKKTSRVHGDALAFRYGAMSEVLDNRASFRTQEELTPKNRAQKRMMTHHLRKRTHTHDG
jgi:hypothetical protein